MIRAKKHSRSKRNQSESDENTDTSLEKHVTSSEHEAGESAVAKNNQVIFSSATSAKYQSKEYKGT